MVSQGKGKKAHFRSINIYETGTRKETRDFAQLTQKEKRLIRSLDSGEREIRIFGRAIGNIKQRLRWLDGNRKRKRYNA